MEWQLVPLKLEFAATPHILEIRGTEELHYMYILYIQLLYKGNCQPVHTALSDSHSYFSSVSYL